MPEPPTVVSQHVEPPRKYVVLTTHGAHIFLKLRPVDLLRQLLADSRGQDTEAVKNFFVMQQSDQACATSLILACLDDPQNSEVAEYATRAFFLYGGEPKVMPSIQGVQTNLCMLRIVINIIFSKVSCFQFQEIRHSIRMLYQHRWGHSKRTSIRCNHLIKVYLLVNPHSNRHVQCHRIYPQCKI